MQLILSITLHLLNPHSKIFKAYFWSALSRKERDLDIICLGSVALFLMCFDGEKQHHSFFE